MLTSSIKGKQIASDNEINQKKILTTWTFEVRLRERNDEMLIARTDIT